MSTLQERLRKDPRGPLCDQAADRIDELSKDAARYQWLRSRIPGSAYRIAGVIYSEGGEGVDRAVDAAMGRAEKAIEPCTWTKDPDFEMGDTWHGTCGVIWSFTEGDPIDNQVNYCHRCGNNVVVA